MRVLVSMFRGVNVGAHHRIKMDALRMLYHALGLADAQTIGHAGNVIFTTDRTDFVTLTKQIEQAFEREFGFHSDVILRTPAELKSIIAGSPFDSRRNLEPGKLHVSFLALTPSAEARAKARAIKSAPEEFHIGGRQIYFYFPNGMARAKLSMSLLEKTLNTSGTVRNWNTVRQLQEAAERQEATAGIRGQQLS